MTHLTTDNLIRVTETLVTHPKWATAMASIGASEQLAFNWLARSRQAQRDDDTASPFFLEWRGVTDYWHVHCGRARKESLIVYEATVRHQAIHGVEVPVLNGEGQYVYKLNPQFIGWSDDDMRLLDFDPMRDRILRDKDDLPVIMTRTEQLPATTRNKVLELIPDYQPHSTMDVRVKSKSVVKVIGARRPPDLSNKSTDELMTMAKLTPPAPQGYGRRAPAPPAVSYARTVSPQSQSPTDNPRGVRAAPLDSAGRGRGEAPAGGFRVVR
ncbi:MAG TPA: hypothetical protein VL048_03840 [Xanthobacteraceae bacterium]|nr:hypothetical protein [Xanthobacteraceae bacterium]